MAHLDQILNLPTPANCTLHSENTGISRDAVILQVVSYKDAFQGVVWGGVLEPATAPALAPGRYTLVLEDGLRATIEVSLENSLFHLLRPHRELEIGFEGKETTPL